MAGPSGPAFLFNFYPRSPYGERLEKVPADVYYQAFLSTLSLRRATSADYSCHNARPDFYPRSPYGERQSNYQHGENGYQFLSTLSLRRATNTHTYRVYCPAFLSTLSLRRATDKDHYVDNRTGISIHALLTESDDFRTLRVYYRSYFYPRSPYGERPFIFSCYYNTRIISIHALLTESDCHNLNLPSRPIISIHALLTESDVFLTLTVRNVPIISIHALLTESDSIHYSLSFRRGYFYPRSPYGERLFHRYCYAASTRFLSTLSLRRATPFTVNFSAFLVFLSTLSLRRATSARISTLLAQVLFLSTLSLRRATIAAVCFKSSFPISIHALLTESDFNGFFC